MPKLKEYSTDFKKAVITALKQGKTQAEVARNFNVSRQLVSIWNKVFNKRGTIENKSRSGRPKKTTTIDRIIKRLSASDVRKSAVAIKNELKENYDTDIHVSTVKRRLISYGLHGRRPTKKPLISAKNQKLRIAFAKRHKLWTSSEWSSILWSDESKFNLVSSDGIKYIRRPVNKRYDVRYQVPTIKHGGGSVMVWGCFSRYGVGLLVRIEGNMDRFMYENILKTQMLPYAKENMPPEWYFQHDNDPKHKSKHITEFMKREKVKVLEWPSQSADLNPIEHLWEELDRRVRCQNYSNKEALFQALKKEWGKIPLDRIQKLVDSMPARCDAVIKANGYATKY